MITIKKLNVRKTYIQCKKNKHKVKQYSELHSEPKTQAKENKRKSKTHIVKGPYGTKDNINPKESPTSKDQNRMWTVTDMSPINRKTLRKCKFRILGYHGSIMVVGLGDNKNLKYSEAKTKQHQ